MVENGTRQRIMCDINCGIYGFNVPVLTPLTIAQVGMLHEACEIKNSLKSEDLRARMGEVAYDLFLHEVRPPFGVRIEDAESIMRDAQATLAAIEQLRLLCPDAFPDELNRIATILTDILS